MAKIVLNGITWGHSRGITPLLAFSQRFSELNPGVEVNWKKRSLQEFADFPIEKLTEHYDLLIIDHPWVGCAAATGCVLPLEQYLSKEYLNEQAANSVGGSHQTYFYKDHQWALAIDAATPVASYRADLFEKNGRQMPSTWEDVIELTKENRVAVPAIPIDSLMNFYMFCIACGTEPFLNDNEVIGQQTGIAALVMMKQLYSLVDSNMFSLNPIGVAELMSKDDQYWYCPFAYGYSNYSRPGYAAHLLHYTDLVSVNGKRLRSTIGGTGIAVSSFSKNKELAVQYAKEIVSPGCQSGLYVQNGGQPGHLLAWENELANTITNNYFKNTLLTLQRGYVRPRYNGYLHFQDHAGEPVQRFLRDGGDPKEVIKELNQIYSHSLSLQQQTVTA